MTEPFRTTVDLTTTYLGLSRSRTRWWPQRRRSRRKSTSVRRLADAGIAAVVLYFAVWRSRSTHESARAGSLSDQRHQYVRRGVELFSRPGALQYRPRAVPGAPTARQAGGRYPRDWQLNGVSTGGWVEYAQRIEAAGADALELNIYYLPTDPEVTSAALEENYLIARPRCARTAAHPDRAQAQPIFHGPAEHGPPLRGCRCQRVGAVQPLLPARLRPGATGGGASPLTLSTSDDLRLPLRWIAMLYGRVPVDFALSGGVHTAEDVLKAMMAGASVAYADIRAARPWDRPRAGHPGRSRDLDDRARVRVDRTDAWEHEASAPWPSRPPSSAPTHESAEQLRCSVSLRTV